MKLKNLRIRQGYRILGKRRQQQGIRHYSVSFRDADEIGILFHANTLDEVQCLKEFFHYLKQQGKKVTVLGYTQAAREAAFKTKSVFFEYFTEKDLNFFFIPSAAKTGPFLEKRFDILINFSLGECFPLTWLTALSQATFRVGTYSPSRVQDLDLMIHLKEDRNIDNFANQLKEYLSLPASA